VVDLTTKTKVQTISVGHGPRKIALQPQPSTTASPMTASSEPEPAVAIQISGFAFSPATVTVRAGQPITFTNADAITHTTTSVTGAWDSGFLAPGASYALTLQEPGTYEYRCAIHPFMQGTLVVTS
jgi:plastocyanin